VGFASSALGFPSAPVSTPFALYALRPLQGAKGGAPEGVRAGRFAAPRDSLARHRTSRAIVPWPRRGGDGGIRVLVPRLSLRFAPGRCAAPRDSSACHRMNRAVTSCQRSRGDGVI
jgi:hypothetical protein